MNDLCVFAVKRGDIQNRIDVKNVLFNLFIVGISVKTVPLGELCLEEPCYGTSATAIELIDDSQPKYIRITDFSDFGIEKNHKYMTAESYTSKHLLQPNDILFARTGGTVGKTYFYDGEIGKAVFAGYCIRFRFDENKVLPKFVYWYTKTDMYQKWVNGIQRPTGQPNINKEEYKSFEIVLPPIDIQQKLVGFMDSANESRQNKIDQSETLLSSMNKYFFDRLNLSHIGFEERLCCAIKLSNIVKDQTFSAEYYHPERMAALHLLKSNTEISAHKLSDIVTFHRSLVSAENSTDYLGLAGVESQTGELSGVQEEATGQAFAYKKDDILYGRLRPYLNKVFLAEKDGICSTEFHVMRVIDTATVLPEYVAAILRSDLILSQTKHMMTGNTHPRISNDDVQNLYIPIPDISIQIQVVDDLRKRRIEARELKLEAKQEWQLAKEHFEKDLLGE